MRDKLTTLPDAIRHLVRDGDSVVLGACLEPNIPFAATYEIIRQGRRGLRMVAPISDASTDMLIGAGCVGGIIGAWVGNVSAGLGHNYRRAAEHGQPNTLEIEDHTNFTLGMALLAGAYGMPYIPTRSALGSDILRSNPRLRVARNPLSDDGEPVVLVPPLKPDVAILCVQRSDTAGNCHHWGNGGVAKEAAIAADRVILLADEIVDTAVITSDPGRVPFPGLHVSAVCHVEGGCHPAPMTGRWRRDHAFFAEYHDRSRQAEGNAAWLREWVLDLPDHAAYRAKLGRRLEDLRVRGDAPSAPANWAAA
ncbi:MAG: CoA transferase subunit A [Hyphomicrobiales bacterium]|nr:CoA transferase subunit A [Hyphomicrobiales bacterium]